MTKSQRQTIALFFLGGSVIDPGGRRGDLVRTPSDVDRWMAQMGETDIIADTEGFFIGSGDGPIGLPEWSEIATRIRDLAKRFDGFVIVHDLATIPPAAVVLSHMLENLEFPVVLVGSPLRPPGARRHPTPPFAGGQEFGAKASMINAVQVAASDAAEVLVVFGSTIFRGRTIAPTVEPWPTLTGTVLGKIDFGTRLFGEQIKRAKRSFKARPSFDTDIGVVEFVPGLGLPQLIDQAGHHHGLFLSATEGLGFTPKILNDLTKRFPDLPVAVYLPTGHRDLPNSVLVLRDGFRTAALLRFMWGVGQTRDPKKLRTLLSPKEKA